jgi:enamine deaminase RidA (YjgF/YER057c/UK114 family)
VTQAGNKRGKVVITTAGSVEPLPWPLSQGIRVGETLFIAGQVALDDHLRLVGAADPWAQARQVWKNVDAVVTAAGGRLEDVVKVVTYVVDFAHGEAIHDVRREMFPNGDFPAATMIQVEKLGLPGLLLETDAVAVIGCSDRYMGDRAKAPRAAARAHGARVRASGSRRTEGKNPGQIQEGDGGDNSARTSGENA